MTNLHPIFKGKSIGAILLLVLILFFFFLNLKELRIPKYHFFFCIYLYVGSQPETATDKIPLMLSLLSLHCKRHDVL